MFNRRDFLKISSMALGAGLFSWSNQDAIAQSFVEYDLVHPNSVDPVMSAQLGREIRIPNTSPVMNGAPNLHASELRITPLSSSRSLMGNTITSTRDPYDDLELALYNLLDSAKNSSDDIFFDRENSQYIQDILCGETRGQCYDGFSLLNYNRGAYCPDHIPGEYKMKRLEDSGVRIVSSVDGELRKVWEVTINLFWVGQNFDSDTYLLRIPYEAHDFDEFVIHWKVYSLIQEDLSPTTILNDGFGRIFHGFDSTFESMTTRSLNELTVKYPTLKHFRGMYIWGWGVHPPRVQFLQPVVEIDADGRLNSAGESFATRCREDLTLENISEAAPEMKAYRVAEAALNQATGKEIEAMLTDPNVGPTGTFREWIELMSDQRQLPPEAWDIVAEEDGLSQGEFGDYDAILAYMNNEIYGENPYAQVGTEGKGGVIKDFEQSSLMRIKVINFDNNTHYYRNVDFSARFMSDISEAFGNGKFSFEKFSPKPSYGVPKVAEMQWRTGWGYVPHLGIYQQSGLFPRDIDRLHVESFTDQFGESHIGYLFHNVSGHWRFNPPAGIREGDGIPAGDPLREIDGSDGVKIGFDTEGFGVAKMPDSTITTHPDQVNFANLNFPGFLRNPSEGGDIIPPTPVWSPFLQLNPTTGSLYDIDGNPWVDQTYFHGRPVFANSSITAIIEAPRASAQLFYQFDPLFHDNMIFSYHPRSDIAR